MKKKLFALPLLSLFALTSCGETSIYGTYSFKMGRSGAGETRIGLSIDLTKDDELDDKGTVLGKKFTLALETDQFEQPYSLSGYYNYVESTKRIKLNAEIKIGGEEETITIPSDLLQYIAITYLDSDTFTLKMPVSMPINPLDLTDINISRILDNDLLHQLVWYGFYFDLDAPEGYWDLRKKNYLPSCETYDINHALPYDVIEQKTIKFDESIEKGLGTHPTEPEDRMSDVDIVNSRFSDLFSRARFYNKETVGEIDTYNLIGSVVPVTNAKGVTEYYFNKLSDDFVMPQPVEGKITIENCYIRSGYLGLSKEKTTMILNEGTYNIVSIKTSSEEVVLPSDYYNTYESFEFRDYHEIRIGLRKE